MPVVAFVDDHSLLLRGIESVIKHSFVDWEAIFFQEIRELLFHLKSNKTNLLVTDLTMPEMNGFDLIQEVRKIQTSIKIAILTHHDGEGYFLEAQKLSVNAYVLKSENSNFFPEIINRVLKGETYISPEMRVYRKDYFGEFRMNTTELAIIQNLILGNSLKEISRLINVSEKVVEYRIKNHGL